MVSVHAWGRRVRKRMRNGGGSLKCGCRRVGHQRIVPGTVDWQDEGTGDGGGVGVGVVMVVVMLLRAVITIVMFVIVM